MNVICFSVTSTLVTEEDLNKRCNPTRSVRYISRMLNGNFCIDLPRNIHLKMQNCVKLSKLEIKLIK